MGVASGRDKSTVCVVEPGFAWPKKHARGEERRALPHTHPRFVRRPSWRSSPEDFGPAPRGGIRHAALQYRADGVTNGRVITFATRRCYFWFYGYPMPAAEASARPQ